MNHDDPRDTLIGRVAKGRTFADLGSLWDAANEKVSVARKAGARAVSMIDALPLGHACWTAFDRRMAELGISDCRRFGSVDLETLDVAAAGGPYDVVHCTGLLDHSPNPLRTLQRLAALTREYLILTSMVVPQTLQTQAGTLHIPEGGALLVPALGAAEHAVAAAYWREQGVLNAVGLTLAVEQWDIADHGPWWWLMPPATLKKMLSVAGLRPMLDTPNWGGRSHTVLCWQSTSAQQAASSSSRPVPAADETRPYHYRSEPGPRLVPLSGAAPTVIEDLIVDIGMNNGDDTAYYLSQNYRVVAVEANPILAEKARQRFAAEIERGQLVLLNQAIDEEPGLATLWVNDENDHWSSLDRSIGGRDGTRHHPVEVECVPFRTLVRQYGMPWYLKIDIEFSDIHVLRDLRPELTPQYLSVEAHKLEYLDLLTALGYADFKMVDQRRHGHNPKMAGKYVFLGGSSGPFGEDTDGDWESVDAVRGRLQHLIETWDVTPPEQRTWYDIHARKPVAVETAGKLSPVATYRQAS